MYLFNRTNNLGWMMHRIIVIVATFVIGCSVPAGVPNDGRGEVRSKAGATDDPDEKWLSQAETESRAVLSNRCPDVAPLRVVGPHDKLFERCVTRVEIALEDEWRRLSEAALAHCVAASMQECCFERYAPGSEYEVRKKVCAEQCSAKRGDSAYGAMGACKSVDVSAEEPKNSRFLTPAVDVVISRCEEDAEAIKDCSGLTTYIERVLCVGNCRRLEPHRMARRAFMRAVARCAEGKVVDESECVLDPRTESEGFTHTQCKSTCLEYRSYRSRGVDPSNRRVQPQ